MNTLIDADTAKLAGLQIDLLHKLRQGHITLDHLEWFNTLTKIQRERLMAEPIEKFQLLADLGIITVPDDYVHGGRLTRFYVKHRHEFRHYLEEITDKNFQNPTRILEPGDKLHVRAFKQVAIGVTTEDRMAFLATQKAVHTGAQGASLVFEQKRNQLPKGFWYVSFDEKERLGKCGVDRYFVPSVVTYQNDSYLFGICDFERNWSYDDAFLCFNEVE